VISLRVFVLLAGLSLSFNLFALTGKVISITDGDTIAIVDSKNVSYKIRLTGIDAPERNQP
jgi:endonuclease YncB( thermonuclease family)